MAVLPTIKYWLFIWQLGSSLKYFFFCVFSSFVFFSFLNSSLSFLSDPFIFPCKFSPFPLIGYDDDLLIICPFKRGRMKRSSEKHA